MNSGNREGADGITQADVVPGAGRGARVLLVEDDLTVRSAVEAALRAEGYEVQVRADGVGIDTAVGEFRPDLAILDVRLPVGPSGYQVARRLRFTSDKISLLFLTAADSVEDRLAGFDAGGDDYLLKPFAMTELLARVQALLQRCGRLRAPVWDVGPLTIDEGSRSVLYEGENLRLTRTEYRLLTTLAQHRGRVLSKTQLLMSVWGPGRERNLVEVHMSALRRKLAAHGPPLVHTVRGAGYVLRS